MNETIAGRAYLYTCDFLKFRDRAEETIRATKVFHCIGICWKFRYGGQIRIYRNGLYLVGLMTDSEAMGHTLLAPWTLIPEDDICIEVIDLEPRWFRWFRRNTAHVTLEGIEEDR